MSNGDVQYLCPILNHSHESVFSFHDVKLAENYVWFIEVPLKPPYHIKRTLNERKIVPTANKDQTWLSRADNAISWMTQQYSQLTNHKITPSANQNWKPKHATRTKRGKHLNRPILKVNKYQYFSCELQSKANLKAVSFLRKTNWTTKIFDLIYLTNKVLCISQRRTV